MSPFEPTLAVPWWTDMHQIQFILAWRYSNTHFQPKGQCYDLSLWSI